ncbi:response regulator [Pollutibacter soli]|uniref:response regulator n=1 Tax=Pollutibacter soli TaxID=3034157 RepID=UPI0030135DAB
MAKILVADDETDLEMLIKQKFRKQIREQKYEFVFAVNGNDALNKISEHPDIDMVLSDINMPEMDGLTLLGKLNETSPLIKAVIVSAYGDMENIRMAMNLGAFDFLTKPLNFEDLELTMAKTMAHVLQMRETLKAIRENNILRMYVDESVLQFMNQRNFENSITVNETIEATVVFIDICGFTMITENEPADIVVKMLNTYFDVIVKEIIDQKGHVDKFIGDAVMAVFRGDFHLDRAIETSLNVRRKIELLKSSEHHGITFMPKVSIGLHTGEVISGNIGSASLRRLDYTVIGDVANTASRLKGVAEDGQIIIAESSYEKVKESFNCRMLHEVVLKNKARPVTIYEVLD